MTSVCLEKVKKSLCVRCWFWVSHVETEGLSKSVVCIYLYQTHNRKMSGWTDAFEAFAEVLSSHISGELRGNTSKSSNIALNDK